MQTSYQAYLKLKEFEYEERCRRCGRCCGVENDPCENLIRLCNGQYFCSDYINRLGLRRTMQGKEFNCVPIKDLTRQDALPPKCAYRNNLIHGTYL